MNNNTELFTVDERTFIYKKVNRAKIILLTLFLTPLTVFFLFFVQSQQYVNKNIQLPILIFCTIEVIAITIVYRYYLRPLQLDYKEGKKKLITVKIKHIDKTPDDILNSPVYELTFDNKMNNLIVPKSEILKIGDVINMEITPRKKIVLRYMINQQWHPTYPYN